jgi:hypothetical protein
VEIIAELESEDVHKEKKPDPIKKKEPKPAPKNQEQNRTGRRRR